MANHIDTGKWGEQEALSYLKEHCPDMKVLYTNWTYKKCEVDIIAKEKDQLVFVEVKTRSSDKFGFPEESVGPKKKQKLAEAAAALIEELNHEGEIRFDILSITGSPNHFEVYYIKDAFFPGLD